VHVSSDLRSAPVQLDTVTLIGLDYVTVWGTAIEEKHQVMAKEHP